MLNSTLCIDTDIKNIISEELDYVFDSKIKAVSEFLCDSTQNVQEYSVSVFSDFMIVQEDIKDAEVRIKTRIYKELELTLDLPKLYSYTNVYDHYERVLSPIIRRHKITNKITSVSEAVIDEAFSILIGKLSSNNIIEFISGKTGTADWLLAGNSKKSQAKRLRENVLNHIKGLLINIKIQVENDMIQRWAFCDDMEDGIAV